MSDFKFTEQERDHLKSEIESRAYIGPDEKIYIGTKDLFDRIEQIVNERDGWIRLEDRLPTAADADENGKVMIYRKMNDSQNAMSKSIHDWLFLKHCDPKETYWQPLPSPPKSEK